MVLMYHNIAEHSGHGSVSISAFEEQIKYIKEHYNIVSIDEYILEIKNKGINDPKHVVVTFDDAYVSYSEIVVPFFRKNSLPSAVFVCTGSIGKSNLWDEAQNRASIMTDAMLLQLKNDDLITIGAHTVTHNMLSKLQRSEIIYELNESKKYIEKLLGKPVNYIAYPYGQFWKNINSAVIKETEQANYKAAFSTNFSVRNKATNLFSLNRIEVVPSDTLKNFVSKLNEHSYYFYKQKIKNAVYYLKS